MKLLQFTVFLLCLLDSAAGTQRLVEPAEFLGGAANVKLVDDAPIVAVESVSIPPSYKMQWEKGQLKSSVREYFMWDRVRPLKTEKGPVKFPVTLGTQIKALLHRPYMSEGFAKGCGYLPTHKFTLDVPGHTLVIYLIDCYDALDVYLDGRQIGGRSGWDIADEVGEIRHEVDRLLSERKEASQTSDSSPATVGAAK